VRRLGAVFDSHRLGYTSTLCAAMAGPERIEAAAAALRPHPGVTHAYVREGAPDLWFTMTAEAARLEAELDRMREAVAPAELLVLPALRRFKINVLFDPGQESGDTMSASYPRPESGDMMPGSCPRDSHNRPRRKPSALTETDRAVVRAVQGNLPLVAEPFAAAAEAAGETQEGLLARLVAWRERGLLRRVAAVVRHYDLGFTANAMCVWQVPPERVEAAGRALAGAPAVSHCYERRTVCSFPSNLYAMLHARSDEELRDLFAGAEAAADLRGGRMLRTVREIKKESPRFFEEP
jgi:DNA-binding Lrp family transcriptional regulator